MKRFQLLLFVLTVILLAGCNKDNPQDSGTIPQIAFNKASEWSIIGTIGGDSWTKDITMKTNGTWHAAFNIQVKATDEFKFRKNKNWDNSLGASSAKVGSKVSLTTGSGNNIKLPAGTYDFYMAETTQIAYFLTAGSDFTHGDEGKVEEGGELSGDYDPALAPSAKKSGITYQLNVYSFADSDGDGWGDFQGIIDHLDYLDAIGATALWLSPVNVSQSYHAYDISDYFAINPKYGGNGATTSKAEEKLKELIAKAKEKNIDIYIDYVLNHSGDQCSWFTKAKNGDSKYRQYYVFSDNPKSDMAAGKIDNFAGQTSGNMGEWHSVAVGNPAYTGSKNLHFKLDISTSSAPKLTVTETTDAAQTDGDSGWYIFDNKVHQMRKTSATVFEITLNVKNDWGVLVKDHASDWGDHKWGAKADDPKITFGTPKTLVKGDAANNIIFGGSLTYYWGSFSGSMPDLNYGPYSTCQNSDAFKDLAASADKWINLGVNGLRLDAVMWIYQCHTDANVKFLSEWYNHCNATYKARGGSGDLYMVGEAYDWNADVVAPYYKGLPSLFDFAYYGTVKDRINAGKGSDLGSTIASIQNKNKNAYNQRKHTHSSGFEDAIKLSNHDENRVASELGNHPQKKRLAGAILLTSPGKPYIYQGEELGYWGVKSSGDQNVRQPINWNKDCKVPTSWCSFDTSVIKAETSVESQAADNSSLLQLYRHFAYARNTHSALAEGEIETTDSGNSAVAAWYMKSSSERVLVMHNLSSASVTVKRSTDKLDKVIVSNHKVDVNGQSVTLPAYSSVVFQQ